VPSFAWPQVILALAGKASGRAARAGP